MDFVKEITAPNKRGTRIGRLSSANSRIKFPVRIIILSACPGEGAIQAFRPNPSPHQAQQKGEKLRAAGKFNKTIRFKYDISLRHVDR